MLKIVKENKSVIRFLLTFGGIYLVLAVLYQWYLGIDTSLRYFPDFFTHLVAEQSKEIIQALGYTSATLPHPLEESVKLYINSVFTVRVVEGCNAISVLILFVSFVFAFHKKWKKTLLFAFAGSVLLYSMNVLRIALLTIGIYEHPEYTEIMHGVIFPAIIYGSVFLLWFLWVDQSTKKQKK